MVHTVWFFISTTIFYNINQNDLFIYNSDVTKVICENEKSTIDCNGREIVIVDAYFGRRDGTTCLKAGQKSESCETGAKSAVTQKCFRRQSCYLEAKSSTFGTECTNTANYLSVTYRCKGLSSLNKCK